MESMTGYGEGMAESSRLRIMATARSLNHRSLDISIRVPERLRRLEPQLIALVRGKLNRGRVELRLEVEDLGDEDFRVRFRLEILRAFRDMLRRAEEQGLTFGDPTAGDILRLPEALVVERRQETIDEEDIRPVVAAAEGALDRLLVSRRGEGKKLEAVLERHLGQLAHLVGELEGMLEELQTAYQQRLKERLEEIRGQGVDPDRLAQEAAILVERSDVREELDRLRFHLTAFDESLGRGEAVGKRLDFISQEIMRELNTIGSKCRDSVAVQRVIDSKVLCEQLREQLQNVQ